MTAPQDPFDPSAQRPSDGPPPHGQQPPDLGQQPPPGYSSSPYGQPPSGYGPPGSGQPGWGQPGQRGTPPGTNGMAIGALIAAFFCSPLGIVLALVAKSQIKQSGQSGNGLATAAIILSVLGLLFGVLLVAGGLTAGTVPT